MTSQASKKFYGWRQEGNHQSLLNQCPASNTCCFSVPPKLGTIIIAFLGLIFSSCYILLFFVGEDILPRVNVNRTAVQVIIHTYAVIGILIFSANIILLIAACKYIQTFILLYLWTTIFYFIFDVIAVLYISVSAIYGKNVTQGVLLCTCDAVYWTGDGQSVPLFSISEGHYSENVCAQTRMHSLFLHDRREFRGRTDGLPCSPRNGAEIPLLYSYLENHPLFYHPQGRNFSN